MFIQYIIRVKDKEAIITPAVNVVEKIGEGIAFPDSFEIEPFPHFGAGCCGDVRRFVCAVVRHHKNIHQRGVIGLGLDTGDQVADYRLFIACGDQDGKTVRHRRPVGSGLS